MKGYTVYFKHASLRQIFTGAATRYKNDCLDTIRETVHQEAPKEFVAGIARRPQAWNLSGELTDSLRDKFMALPFVDRIETNDEAKVRLAKRRSPAEVIKGWVQDIIYRYN